MQTVVDALNNIGHDYSVASEEDGFAAVTAISKKDGFVDGAWDKRRSGRVVLF